MVDLKTKYIDKRSWRRLLDKTYSEKRIETSTFDGIVGLITMKKVKSPLEVEILGENVRVVDVGYQWLQILPKDKHYSITVMYNEKHEPIQYYFDINEKNILELGKARAHDLYLDVLVLPDGRYELVDEKDLHRALKHKDITKAQFDFAYQEAEAVMESVKTNFLQYVALAKYCKEEISNPN